MNFKETGTENLIKIFKGIAISCIVTIVLLVIYAALLTYTNIPENTMMPVIIAITAVSILARKWNTVQVLSRKME